MFFIFFDIQNIKIVEEEAVVVGVNAKIQKF